MAMRSRKSNTAALLLSLLTALFAALPCGAAASGGSSVSSLKSLFLCLEPGDPPPDASGKAEPGAEVVSEGYSRAASERGAPLATVDTPRGVSVSPGAASLESAPAPSPAPAPSLTMGPAPGGRGALHPSSPWFSGFRLANTLRVSSTPSDSSYEVSERGDLGMELGPVTVGLLVEALKQDSSSPDDRDPVRFEERYAEYHQALASDALELAVRAGTRTNLGFESGLVAGALHFDGFSLASTVSSRFSAMALWGVTREILPEMTRRPDLTDPDPYPDPVDPYGDEQLDVAGAHFGYDNRDDLNLGLTLLGVGANGDEEPGDVHVGVGGSLVRDRFNLEGEAAFSRNGGRGAYLKAAVNPQRFTTLTFGARDYRGMKNRINLPPLYSGVSGGDDTDDLGFFASVDVAPWDRISAGLAVDTTRRHDGTDARTDALLHLEVLPVERLSALVTWEVERGSERDPRILTLMGTYRLDGGARLSGRFSRDSDGAEAVNLFNLSGQYPVLDRKLTLLAEHTIREAAGEFIQTPQLGCTVRLWNGSFFTFRYSLGLGTESDSLTATLFSRY